jgi:hypothetical protein
MASFSAALYGNVVQIAGWRRMFRAAMLSAVALCAQSGDWAQVRALAPGTQVEVKRFSGGGEVRGTVESVSDDAVIVRGRKGMATVDRADVRRLRLTSDQKTKSGRITGTAILGGIALSCVMVCDGSAAGKAGVAGIYAGLGYLIGWAVDGPKRIVLYKAEKP